MLSEKYQYNKVYVLLMNTIIKFIQTLSADPVITKDPSSFISTANTAALCPNSVVFSRQWDMFHTLACNVPIFR